MSYSPISSDHLIELYRRRAEVVVAIYSKCVVYSVVEKMNKYRKLTCYILIWYLMQLMSLFGNMWLRYNEYDSNLMDDLYGR